MGQTTSLIRRHVGAAIASGVAVLALAGGGIAYAATSPGSSAPAKASPPPTTAPAAGAHGSASAHGAGTTKTKHPGLRGTVTAVNGGAWTVKTAKGVSMTVTVTPQTVFGTKKAPSSASSFPVGSTVRVVGQRTGTTITATRIIAPKPAGGSTTGTTGASATAAP
ncbi:MAG: DUF5666 domain-containing protein [Actinomycetota bacterium]|nr:DUF5666 domain-containing protein [Actinomycetota bacterium]